jgi:Mrp family chromosome partitioning ATPase/DUF971 family protein
MSRESDVLDSMRHIMDPDLGRDIVSLGFIKNLQITEAGQVSFVVELTTPACPVKEHFRSSCIESVSRLPWVTKVEVTMSAAARSNPLVNKSRGLEKVATIVAVSSCKGGVGKSTVAVNLAYSLSLLGGKVGLFDADVYGPSLPTMVSPARTELFMENELIVPLEYEGVKLMSFGFASPGGGAAIMRGPMVSQVINQLLTTTNWGELDYLVLDLPPGTGDIQLTLTQLIPITAAVIVTTPQQLSYVDVVKGIQMFDKLKVPTVAVVENMSYFQCPGCGTRHHLFGQGARARLVEQFGIRNSFEVPLRPEVSQLSDRGTPVVLADREGPAAAPYREIAASVVQEISKLVHGGIARPKVAYKPGAGILITLASGEQHTVPPADLRRACRCAHCIEEFSGRPLLDPSSVSEAVYPRSMQPMGNYAVAVTWSDGHDSSIYPYETILKLAQPGPTG